MIKQLPKPITLVSFAVVVAAAGSLPALASQTAAGPRANGHAARSKKHCFHVRVRHRKVERCLVRGPRGPRGFLGPAGPRGAKGSRGRRGPAGAIGPPGSARAYALVDPAGVGQTASTNGLVSARTSHFASVRRSATGAYCLAPATGIDPTRTAPAVSGDAGASSSGLVPVAVLNSGHPACQANELEVDTYSLTASGAAASNGAAFTIVVP
jgi:hypothetical protein